MAVNVHSSPLNKKSLVGSGPRRQRSRSALLHAFADLVQTCRYEEITIADLVRHARVGRSTFYEHFQGKDGILTTSIAGPFAVLAECIRPESDSTALLRLLEHFWTHRGLARGLMLGPARHKTMTVLVTQVENRLKANEAPVPVKLLLPRRFVAIQVAEVLMAPITAWLVGESRCTPAMLAYALPRAARAVMAVSLSPR